MLEKGAWVISCSWGAKAARYELSELVRGKITECAEKGRGGKGCVIVFAAGNDNRDVYDPDQSFIDGFVIHEKVIGVAASTSIDTRALCSNFGKKIWVCAPSGDSGQPVGSPTVSDITTTDLNGSYFEHFLGTSGACALVAGICGLILSANPELTAEEVKQILRKTARPIDRAHGEYDPQDHSIFYGYGCVHAEAAVEEALRMRTSVAPGVS
jgi:subtilisin family serine protease